MGVKRQPGMVPKALQKAGFEFPQICSSSIHRRCGKDSFATRRSTEMAGHGRWSHLTISEICIELYNYHLRSIYERVAVHIHALNKKIADDPRVTVNILPIGSGLTIATKL